MGDANTLSLLLTILGVLTPIIFGFITLIIKLAQTQTRIQVLEDKVKTLFELINRLTYKN